MNKLVKVKKKNKIAIIITIIAIVIIAYSSIKIYIWVLENNKSRKEKNKIDNITIITEKTGSEEEKIQEEKEILPTDPYWDFIKMNYVEVDFQNLLKENQETVSWITVNGTNINYPVVQHSDNEYYLNHSFDGSENSAGWIYLDYRNNIENTEKNTTYSAKTIGPVGAGATKTYYVLVEQTGADDPNIENLSVSQLVKNINKTPNKYNPDGGIQVKAFSSMAELTSAMKADYGENIKTVSSYYNKDTNQLELRAETFADMNDPVDVSLHVGADSSSDNKIYMNIAQLSARALGINGLDVRGDTGDAATAALLSVKMPEPWWPVRIPRPVI